MQWYWDERVHFLYDYRKCCKKKLMYCSYLSSDKETVPEAEMSIPGLDWGMDEVMQKDLKKPPTKKVPYAKPIPAQFQQVSYSRNKLQEPT